MEIIIDTKDYQSIKERFEKMHSSIFPRIVRNTLNDLAFDMKGVKGQRGTIETRGSREFDYRRNPTFLKAMTGVNKATGRNISTMYSEAGVMERSGKDKAARGLAKQEEGGKIKHAFIPTTRSRISSNITKKVSSRNKHANLNRYIDLTSSPPVERAKLLWEAHRDKKPVLIRGRGARKNKTYLAMPYGRVKGFKKTGGIRVPLKFIYIRSNGGFVHLRKKRPFVQTAGEITFKKVGKYFIKNVKKELEKL